MMRFPFARRDESAGQVTELREQLGVERNNVEILQESVSDLEAQLREPGWVRMVARAEVEFSRQGLGEIAAASRLMAIKNPLIIRGLALRSAYIWGQGVGISARATGQRDGADGEQDVNAVVQAFISDEANQRVLTGEEAHARLERTLGCDGNLFVALFTKPTTGRVQARTIQFDQMVDVICNPEDVSEPWYYRRRWNETTTDPATGVETITTRERLYPAVGYRPVSRPRRFGPVDVVWDSPVIHVKINDLDGWKWGIGDVYAAVDWALAYKDFLTDWARLMKSLSRYAWKLTAKGSRGAAAARTRIAQAPSLNQAGEPNHAGATAAMTADMQLESVSKSGATLDSESGRPLAAMVAAALGVPVTMLLGDPGVSGARATAETLDRPTELGMQQRQAMWATVLRRILTHVITEATRAPQGALRGRVRRDEDGRETVTLDGDTDTTIDITWPDLDDTDPAVLVEAITKAAGTGTVPPDLVLRLLLQALGVQRTDEIIERMVDDDGRFLWPSAPPLTADPGSMTPDDEYDGGNDDDQPGDDEAPERASGNGGGRGG